METTVNEAGHLTVPDKLERELKLAPGQKVVWQRISETECRLYIQQEASEPKVKPDPMAAIGFAKRHGLPTMTTAEYMKMLYGEEA